MSGYLESLHTLFLLSTLYGSSSCQLNFTTSPQNLEKSDSLNYTKGFSLLLVQLTIVSKGSPTLMEYYISSNNSLIDEEQTSKKGWGHLTKHSFATFSPKPSLTHISMFFKCSIVLKIFQRCNYFNNSIENIIIMILLQTFLLCK